MRGGQINYFKVALATLPALLSMYLLFYLESNQLWDRESAIRDLHSLLILVLGLASSFWLLTRALRGR